MKLLLVPALFLLVACLPSPEPAAVIPTVTITPPPLTGVFKWNGGLLQGITFDDVSNVKGVVTVAAALPKPSSVRVVLDPETTPTDYKKAVSALSQVTTVMATIADSSDMKSYTVASYAARAKTYIDGLPEVIIWEVGNELNGDWLGGQAAEKMLAASEIARGAGKQTALTLYYNKGCLPEGHPEWEMFTWAKAHIPAGFEPTLVLVSFYEQDCPGVKPDWAAVFTELAQMFPLSYVGFGEVGTERGDKVTYLTKYYSMRFPGIPAFMGGWFWWYGTEDFVGKISLLNTMMGVK